MVGQRSETYNILQATGDDVDDNRASVVEGFPDTEDETNVGLVRNDQRNRASKGNGVLGWIV